MRLTLTERYLAGYHDMNPGVTSRSFAACPVTNGAFSFGSTYEALLAALTDSGAPLTVLDLACGDGHLLALLADAPATHTLIGIDLSGGELAAARARLGARARLCRDKAQQLPLATSSVDAITCHLALMLMDDAEAMFAELQRVLRPGGTLAALVGARSPSSPSLDTFVRLYPVASQRAEVAGIRFGDRRFRSAESIAGMLAAGFEAPDFETLTSTRDFTPTQLWDWFSDMYDTDLLKPAALADFRQACRLAWQALCGPEGTLRHEDRYQLFSARARA